MAPAAAEEMNEPNSAKVSGMPRLVERASPGFAIFPRVCRLPATSTILTITKKD
jgi:hypothetical protein